MASERQREPQGESSIPVRCFYCEEMVAAQWEAEYTGSTLPEDRRARGTVEPLLFVLYSCPTCTSPFFAYFDQRPSLEDSGWDWARQPDLLYPATQDAFDTPIPDRVGKAFREANRCFDSGTYTGCVFLCRKTLEGLCHEHGVRERDLAKSLATMKDKKLIEEQLYIWATELRFAGNDAAHDTEQSVTREVASDVLDFSRAILEFTYTYRQKFKEFQERRVTSDDGFPF